MHVPHRFRVVRIHIVQCWALYQYERSALHRIGHDIPHGPYLRTDHGINVPGYGFKKVVKRVLVISRNFPPLWGGMERLNLHMVEELSRRFEVRLVGPQGAADHSLAGVVVTEVPLRPLWLFLFNALWRSLRLVRVWRPDIVLAGSGLVAPLALLVARSCGAKVMAYVHGLDLAVTHPVYRALWRPSLRRLDGVIANSHATAELACEIGVAPEATVVIHPGVSIPPVLDSGASEHFRKSHGLGTVPILLSVGRLTTRKGLREFVSDVLPMITARYPEVQLVVIGDVPADALYAESQSIESIQAAADTAGVGKNIRFFGTRFGSELAEAYAAANVHVFPVRHIADDPEGFGMVAIEAAAHGVVTVAYATGGVVDAVRHGQSGLLVACGDGAGFAQAVISLLETPLPQNQPREFAERFSWSRFGHQIAMAIRGVDQI